MLCVDGVIIWDGADSDLVGNDDFKIQELRFLHKYTVLYSIQLYEYNM